MENSCYYLRYPQNIFFKYRDIIWCNLLCTNILYLVCIDVGFLFLVVVFQTSFLKRVLDWNLSLYSSLFITICLRLKDYWLPRVHMATWHGDTFALLALFGVNPAPMDSSHNGPETCSFANFFVVSLSKLLNIQLVAGDSLHHGSNVTSQ